MSPFGKLLCPLFDNWHCGPITRFLALTFKSHVIQATTAASTAFARWRHVCWKVIDRSVDDLQARPASPVRVEPVEVAGDDRHRDSQRQDAGDGTRSSDDPSHGAFRHLVSVADRCHGDDGPPERVRDALDLRLRDADFGVVDGTRVDQHADGQCHEEHAQTFHTRVECHYQHL